MLNSSKVRTFLLRSILATIACLSITACSDSKETTEAEKSTTATTAKSGEVGNVKFDACGVKDLFHKLEKDPSIKVGEVYSELLAGKKDFVGAVPDDLKDNAESVIKFVEAIVAKKPLDQKLSAEQPKNATALREWSESACK